MGKDLVVSIASCETYEGAYDAYIKALTPLGGISKFVKKGDIVALKPNLIASMKPELGATTHPEAMRAVIRIVREAGGIPRIVESPGGPTTTVFVKNVFKGCKITQMAAEENVEISWDMDTVSVDNPHGKNLKKVNILKALVDADVIINMPKPKPHGMMMYTGAVKNMFGAIAGTSKIDFHFRQANYDDFANSIIDILLASKPTLNLMDAVVTMHKKGPSSGEPIDTKFVMASDDAFAMDSVALEILKVDRKKVYVINQGIIRGLCPSEMSEIQVYLNGAEISDLKPAMINGYILPAKSERKVMEIFSKMPKWLEFMVRSRPVFSKKRCKRCKICVESCPAKCLVLEEKCPKVDLDKCIRCFCCEELCPYKAVDIKRFIF